MNLSLLLLGTIGATCVLTQGVIVKPVRSIFPALLCCPMCSGFWVGLVAGAAWSLEQASAWHLVVLEALCIGFATSILSTAATIAMMLAGSYVRSDRVGRHPDDPCRSIEKAPPAPGGSDARS